MYVANQVEVMKLGVRGEEEEEGVREFPCLSLHRPFSL